MIRPVAEQFDAACQRGRKLGVYEKAQSCAPQHRVVVLLGGELEHRGKVLGLEIRVSIVPYRVWMARTRAQKSRMSVETARLLTRHNETYTADGRQLRRCAVAPNAGVKLRISIMLGFVRFSTPC